MKTTIIQMIHDICIKSGVSRDEIAAHLGKSIVQFNNSLYQANGQEFKIHELLELQRHYGVSNFTSYVCANTGKDGGVYVATPDAKNLDKKELYDIAMVAQKALANFNLAFAKALDDGVITDKEYRKLEKLQCEVFACQIHHLCNAHILYRKAH